MIYNKNGQVYDHEGKTFTVGSVVMSNDNSDYPGLYGIITEIRDGADIETDYDGPDIYCSFEIPESSQEVERIEALASKLWRTPKKVTDLGLDVMIMAPEEIDSISDVSNKNCATCAFKSGCLKRQGALFMLYIQSGRTDELTDEVRENFDCGSNCLDWIFAQDVEGINDMGVIKLGDKVIISDPSYDLDGLYQCVLYNVLFGSYRCFSEYKGRNIGGLYVKAIELHHEDYSEYNLEPNEFQITVDSGQAGVFDYEYFAKHHTHSDTEETDEEWSERVDEITNTRNGAGTTDDVGFVASSGYGDGIYTCYTARNKDGKIVAIRVVFIEDEDEVE